MISLQIIAYEEMVTANSSRRTGTREVDGERRERRRDILVATATTERIAYPVHRLHSHVRAGSG